MGSGATESATTVSTGTTEGGDTMGTGASTSDGSGTTGVVCDPTLTACGEACVDLQTDPAHCGSCDAACGLVCAQGTCMDPRTWGTPEVIDDADGTVLLPRIAMMPSSQAVVVWSQNEDQSTRLVRAARYDGTWTNDGAISGPTGFDDKPEVAVNPDGDALVAWHRTGGGPPTVWAAGFQGGSWTAEVRISADNEMSIVPRVAIGPDGNGIAVWQQIDRFILRRYVASTMSWESEEMPGGMNTGDVRVEIAADGAAIVAWIEADNNIPSAWSCRYVQGSGCDQASPIESSNWTILALELAVNPAGDAVAVWQAGTNNANDGVFASVYDVDAGTWSASSDALDSSSKQAFSPRVAMDAAGNAVAVWIQTEGGGQSIWANRYVSGQGWEGVETLEDSSETAQEARVAMDAAGNAVAVWVQADGNAPSLWANRYVVGLGWTGPERVETMDGNVLEPDVAMGGDGVAIAVWKHETAMTLDADIYASVLQ